MPADEIPTYNAAIVRELEIGTPPSAAPDTRRGTRLRMRWCQEGSFGSGRAREQQVAGGAGNRRLWTATSLLTEAIWLLLRIVVGSMRPAMGRGNGGTN